MRRRRFPTTRLGGLWEPIERLAQVNIGLILTQAIIVRLSVELGEREAADTDPLLLITLLAACVISGVLVFHLYRLIRRFPHRWLRITIALGTVLLQAGAFQVLHAYSS